MLHFCMIYCLGNGTESLRVGLAGDGVMTYGGDGLGFEVLAERLIGEHWGIYPTAGARIGRHEFDGRLPDLAPGRLRRRVGEIRRGMAELQALEAAAPGTDAELSRRMLGLFLERELFTFEELRPLENNPMRQAGFLNLGGYIRRDYAPAAERLDAATAALRQVPDFLHTLDAALREELSRPVAEMSAESYAGMARFYRTGLAPFAGVAGHPEIAVAFTAALAAAAAALDGFVARLKGRAVDDGGDGFAIGSRLYSRMLATGEGLDWPLERIVAVGEANLEENLARIREVAAAIDPGKSVPEIVAEIGREHPAAEGLIPETRDMLEDIRQALLDYDVVSLPRNPASGGDDRCQVAETPEYMRYAFAAMDSAGALETRATESFYYVTPVEAGWSAAQAQEWLSNFNYNTLRIVSIHEVYPGHFVHHLHNRYGRALPLVNRVATSYAFSEGWAHYAEEMMLETGYGEGRLRLRLTQLLEALVRNCRYVCAIAMHTGGMTVAEATRFFVDNAYMGEHPARREALRGTFDPGYLNYTLGKLMLLKLREDYRRELAGGYSRRGFHDRVLSYGAPPIPLLRRAMLAGDDGAPL